jgi:hypothetical protein
MIKKHALHAQRIIKILETTPSRFECARSCPMPEKMFLRAYNRYKRKQSTDISKDHKEQTADRAMENYCVKICNGLINHDPPQDDDGNYIAMCPCHVLGIKEAIKRTWITLDEKGYLEP